MISINKIKTYGKIIFLGLAIMLTTSALCQALVGIDPSFRPSNLPLGEASELQNLTEGRVSAAAQLTISLLQIISGALLYFAAPLAVVIISASGLLLIVGSDDSEKVGKFKSSLTWAVIGLLTIILSYTVVRIILTIIIRAATSA